MQAAGGQVRETVMSKGVLWHNTMSLDGFIGPAEFQNVGTLTRGGIAGLYRRVWKHTDATINSLAIDAPGYVPCWRAGSHTGEPLP